VLLVAKQTFCLRKRFAFCATALLLQTTRILYTVPFADLSGCKAECTYQDTTYGNITPEAERNETWFTPTIPGNRTSETDCQLPEEPVNYTMFKNAKLRFELTEPTIIKEDDNLCSQTYLENYVSDATC
jgi:hypothetical protein